MKRGLIIQPNVSGNKQCELEEGELMHSSIPRHLVRMLFENVLKFVLITEILNCQNTYKTYKN